MNYSTIRFVLVVPEAIDYFSIVIGCPFGRGYDNLRWARYRCRQILVCPRYAFDRVERDWARKELIEARYSTCNQRSNLLNVYMVGPERLENFPAERGAAANDVLSSVVVIDVEPIDPHRLHRVREGGMAYVV